MSARSASARSQCPAWEHWWRRGGRGTVRFNALKYLRLLRAGLTEATKTANVPESDCFRTAPTSHGTPPQKYPPVQRYVWTVMRKNSPSPSHRLPTRAVHNIQRTSTSEGLGDSRPRPLAVGIRNTQKKKKKINTEATGYQPRHSELPCRVKTKQYPNKRHTLRLTPDKICGASPPPSNPGLSHRISPYERQTTWARSNISVVLKKVHQRHQRHADVLQKGC